MKGDLVPNSDQFNVRSCQQLYETLHFAVSVRTRCWTTKPMEDV